MVIPGLQDLSDWFDATSAHWVGATVLSTILGSLAWLMSEARELKAAGLPPPRCLRTALILTARWIRKHRYVLGSNLVLLGIIYAGILGFADKNAELRQRRERTQPVQQAVPQRDPDTIYQHDKPAGLVVGANVIPTRSVVSFAEINSAGNLDRSAPFEYRDYILQIEESGGMTLIGRSRNGSLAQNIIPNVQCKIIGTR
jgi:hypothetical protein